MRKKLASCATLCLLAFPFLTFADKTNSFFQENETKSGFFFGLAVSNNDIVLEQSFAGSLNSAISYNDAPFATAILSGLPSASEYYVRTTYAPEAQLGYFKKGANSNFLWGSKFSYQYLNATLDPGVWISQEGTYSLVSDPSAVEPIYGGISAYPVETSLKHKLSLIPFIGHSFEKNHVYLGAGPVVFGMQTKFYNLDASFDVEDMLESIVGDEEDNTLGDIMGKPVTTATSKHWLWGGAAQLGLTHFFSASCFLDVSYTYALTGKYKTNDEIVYFASSRDVSTGDKLDLKTQVALQSKRQVTAQSITLSLNHAF